MLAAIFAALALLIYGIYRATRRWGLAALWYIAATAAALDASGLLAEHLWGLRYSWNLSHHGSDSLPATLTLFCFSVGLALWFRDGHALRTESV